MSAYSGLRVKFGELQYSVGCADKRLITGNYMTVMATLRVIAFWREYKTRKHNFSRVLFKPGGMHYLLAGGTWLY